MVYIFELNNAIEGKKIISQPQGWKEAVIGVTRHPDFHCRVAYFQSSFSLYGSNGVEDGGRDYCLNIWKTQGPDALITVTIYFASSDNAYDIKTLFTGIVNSIESANIVDFSHDLQVAFDPDDFWTKLIARAEVPVNILSTTDLDGNTLSPQTPSDVVLKAQPINEVATFDGHSGDTTTTDDCYLATTANLVLSGHQTIDGVITLDQMRVLVKNQTTQKDNGIYNASSGTWFRAADANTSVEVELSVVKVTNGTINGNKVFRQTTTPLTLGTSNVVYVVTNYIDVTQIWDGPGIQGPPVSPITRYAHLTLHKLSDEIVNTFELSNQVIMDSGFPTGLNHRNANLSDVQPCAELVEVGGAMEIDLVANWVFYFGATFKLFSGGTQGVQNCTAVVKIWKDVNGVATLITTVTNTVASGTAIIPAADFATQRTFDIQVPISITTSTNISSNPSDIIKFYAGYTLTYNYYSSNPSNDLTYSRQTVNGGILNIATSIKLTSLTLDSNNQGILIHDLFANVLERTVGKGNIFYSDLLGGLLTKRRAYNVNGKYWKYLTMPGLQVKQWLLSEKPFSIALLDIWKGLNPVLNIGLKRTLRNLGNGVPQDAIEVFKASEFYQPSPLVGLYGVKKIKKTFYKSAIFNQVQTGYKNGKTDVAQGIDDPISQTRAMSLKRIGDKKEIMSEFIAASLAWEGMRRLPKSNKNQNNNNDDKVFLLSLNDSAIPLQPSLDEEYTSVTGLQNEALRYNKDIWPERNLLRWRNSLIGCLQNALSSTLKFESGEGNFAQSSTMLDNGDPERFEGNALAGNADIPLSSDMEFDYLPQLYEIEHEMTEEEFNTFMINPDNGVNVSQGLAGEGGEVAMMIEDLKWNPSNGILHVLAVSKVDMDIKVVTNGEIEDEMETIGRVFTDEFSPVFS